MLQRSRGLLSETFHRTRGKSLLLWAPLVFLLLLSLSSCSSSTAIQGTPVNEVATLEDRVPITRMQTEQNLEALARMSEVKQNAVFETVAGRPLGANFFKIFPTITHNPHVENFFQGLI